MPTKTAVLRAAIDGSPSPCNIARRYPSRRSRDILTHSFLSQTSCGISSSFRIFHNQDKQFVLCRFVVVVIVIFRHQASNLMINRNKWVLVLSTKLPSLVSSSDSTCSHARVTPSSMLGMSRRNMMFDFQLGRSTSDNNNMGSQNFNRFIIHACTHNLALNRHDLQLRFDCAGRQLLALPMLAIGLTTACFACIDHKS